MAPSRLGLKIHYRICFVGLIFMFTQNWYLHTYEIWIQTVASLDRLVNRASYSDSDDLKILILLYRNITTKVTLLFGLCFLWDFSIKQLIYYYYINKESFYITSLVGRLNGRSIGWVGIKAKLIPYPSVRYQKGMGETVRYGIPL